VSDITERKTTEEQLRWNAQELQRSEFYLAEGQRLGQAGSWALNPSGFFEYWSRELFQIYGLDPQKGAPTLEQYLATVHPQDRDFMAETVKTMCEQGSGCDAKKRSFDRTARFAIFDALVFQSSTTGFSKGFLAPPWM
jgi:PAS domain-containing protein